MNAKDIAYQVTKALDEFGYPYLGVTLHLGSNMPYIELWDDRSQTTAVIVCSEIKDNSAAREFIDHRAKALETEQGERGCGVIGYVAEPHPDVATSIVLKAWIEDDGEEYDAPLEMLRTANRKRLEDGK